MKAIKTYGNVKAFEMWLGTVQIRIATRRIFRIGIDHRMDFGEPGGIAGGFFTVTFWRKEEL